MYQVPQQLFSYLDQVPRFPVLTKVMVAISSGTLAGKGIASCDTISFFFVNQIRFILTKIANGIWYNIRLD